MFVISIHWHNYILWEMWIYWAFEELASRQWPGHYCYVHHFQPHIHCNVVWRWSSSSCGQQRKPEAWGRLTTCPRPWGSLYTDIMGWDQHFPHLSHYKLYYSASEYHTYMLLKTVTTPTPTTYLHYTSPVCMNQRVQGKCKATPTRTTALGVTQLPGQLSRQQGSSLQHNTSMFFSLE